MADFNLRLTRYFILFSLLSIFIWPKPNFAQTESEYDEIAVFISIPPIGGFETLVIVKDEVVYLPITNLFDFLKIRNIPSTGLDSVSGFFINPQANFFINKTDNVIHFQDKVYTLEAYDLIQTETNLYLKSPYFGEVFGLDCVFNFRNLSVTLNSKLELPVIREMRQEELRNNLNRLKGEVSADTTIGRSYPFFKFGMFDWSVRATQEINGDAQTQLNLTIGAMIAGGEAEVSLNYNSEVPFTEQRQYYLWRYVNNNFKPIRQVMVGKIATPSIATIYHPVIGVKITNTPTTFKRSLGTYTLSDRTEPGWIVELYVNNILINYVKADASGFFTFEVPLVYGNSMVSLRFFGPWGEERTREQNINIPFNFLPKNTMEYAVSAGIVEDPDKSRFLQARINYGLTPSLTVGGGVEYLSSLTPEPAMPFIHTSLRVFNNLLFSGEYTYGVRTQSTLTYRFASNLQFALNYTRYNKDQKAIHLNYTEERKLTLSMPLRIRKFSSFQRFSFYQVIFPGSTYKKGEWLFSGFFLGINTNLSTYASFIADTKPMVYSSLSLALRLPEFFVIMPQVQYEYSRNRLLSLKLALEKRLLTHGFLNMSYEYDFSSNRSMVEVGFRFDFSFAQTVLSMRQYDNKSTLMQYARGSLLVDKKTKYFGYDNRSNVGKGGISIIPYLDLNANGRKDPGEPKVYGLNLHTNSGRVEKSESDTTILILGLEPYTHCFIKLDPNSFENIAWRLPIKTLSVVVDPNTLKYIEVPITVAGEASGVVSLYEHGEKKGLERIIINFYTSNDKPAGKTLTEEGGYFSYLGLAPGSYLVRVDNVQLQKLGMKPDADVLRFVITQSTDGDIVDGLDFTLHKE